MPKTPEDLEKARKWIYPGAAGMLESAARDQGLEVYSKTLRCEVQGLNGPLKDHEQNKAADFAKEFLSATGEGRAQGGEKK